MDINVKKEILEHLNIIQNLINEAPVTKSDEPETRQPREIALKDMAQGSVFVFKDKEFIKLGEEQGGVLCITRDFWGKEQEFGEDANYKTSKIKDLLEKEFWDNKEDKAILNYTMDLTSNNGDDVLGSYTSNIGLLTCDLVRKYYKVIPRYKDWWWTCTPWGYSAHAGNVYTVYTSGALNYNNAYYSNGVVPACILDGQTLISCDSNCK